MKTPPVKTECDRCGTCCLNGGPALHFEDKILLQQKILLREHLITIRKGEPVITLDSKNPEPAAVEIVKIKGKGSDWTCYFYDSTKGCAIYRKRPLECFLLKCWDTADLENVAGKNLVARSDLLAPGDPVHPFIQLHDDRCSLAEASRLISEVQTAEAPEQSLLLLENLVNTDMAIRTQAIEKLHLTLDLELFCFGRPLFKFLPRYDINIQIRQNSFKLSVV